VCGDVTHKVSPPSDALASIVSILSPLQRYFLKRKGSTTCGSVRRLVQFSYARVTQIIIWVVILVIIILAYWTYLQLAPMD
jgi:hypothetical protein